MFTGLIEDIGTIRRMDRAGDDYKIEIEFGLDTSEIKLGDSIAVNGACYTVIEILPRGFIFEASQESAARTNLQDTPVGSRVHIERAMQIGARLDGHIVQGHVDGVGTVLRNEPAGKAYYLEIQAPKQVFDLLVPKGSIAINGTSLTVNSVDDQGGRFDVMIIPFTSGKTLLTDLAAGDRVNLEADILGKYVLRLLKNGLIGPQEPHDAAQDATSGLDLDFLRRHGFA